MKFLHMIPPSSRTMGSFVDMIEKYYPEGEHSFYSTKRIPRADDLSSREDLVSMKEADDDRSSKARHVYKALSDADVVVWHGFFYPDRFMLFLYVFRKFLKKSVWVIWGLDLHNWKNPQRTLKARFFNHVNQRVRKMIKRAVVVFPTDKAVYESQYKGECFVAPYPMTEKAFARLEARRRAKPRANGKTFVQIAHNGYPFNRHEDVMADIARFDDDSFEYFFPMSYGNENEWAEHIRDYKLKVVETARDTYGERATFINKLIDKEEYNDFLWNIDIAIFAANRQNGIGNIIKLFYMGNKVFLSKDNPVYSYFQNEGIEVYAFESIPGISKEDFLAKPAGDRARDWVVEHYHPLNAARAWDEVFSRYVQSSPLLKELEGVSPRVLMDESFAFERKKNNLCLLPYISPSVPITCTQVCLVGAGNMALRWAGYIRKGLPKFIPAGFVSDEVETFAGRVGELDVIAGTGQIAGLAEDRAIVCTIEDPFVRGALFRELVDMEIPLNPVILPGSQVWPGTDIGDGTMISQRSVILPGATIGECVIVEESRIGANCVIGDYVTLLAGSNIGDGSVIEDYATIGPGVCVPDGVVVPGGSNLVRKES